MRTIRQLVEPFRVTDGAKFRHEQIDPDDTLGMSKDATDG